MSSPASRIVIIGAGIGGLTPALLLLRRRGIIAEILEQAPELREVGAAVALAANGGDEPRYAAASGSAAWCRSSGCRGCPTPPPCSSKHWQEQSATSTRTGRDDGRPVPRRRSRLGR